MAEWVNISVTSSEKNPTIAMRPFHRSARAVKGPKLRASVDSPLMMGTSDAYVSNCTATRKYSNPVCPGAVSWSITVLPVISSATTAHTIPTMASLPLMVSGAAPSNANTLQNDLLPVSVLLSTSGRGYKDPDVGSVPITDFFSDSLVSWFRRMSSSVSTFFVLRPTASLTSAKGPLLPPASHRTLPARDVVNLAGAATNCAPASFPGLGRSDSDA
uniref:Uncharacterized protein n=1 Tax=Physcomitrium patens TaxID=3218 RepID=A0A2K1JG02_PHYPA|nr:hypothetical protein PHYPA_017865 [Physcomitrium patens]